LLLWMVMESRRVPSTGEKRNGGNAARCVRRMAERNTRPVEAWKTFDLTLRSPSLLIVGWRCVVRSRPALWALLALGKGAVDLKNYTQLTL